MQMTLKNPYFDPFDGSFFGALPDACIKDCSARVGRHYSASYWRKKLNFEVPRDLAIAWLSHYGAWPTTSSSYETGLLDMGDAEIAEKVLWLACCDLYEHGEWLGLVI